MSVTHWYPTLCDPMDCNLPGSSVHGIFQARILEWVAILFSRGSSPPRDWTWISCIAGRFSTFYATTEAHLLWINVNICSAEFPHLYSFCAYSIWRVQALWDGFWKIPWRREWLPTSVFLPGEFHGQRSLVGYSPWGCRGLDMTEHNWHFPKISLCPQLTLSFHSVSSFWTHTWHCKIK